MFALILETLSSQELIFILVIALIFFGPRKLPQLARSMGKGLAEFRKASDDFKRTWEREVAAEESRADSENTILAPEELATQPPALIEEKPAPEPLFTTADPELAVARGSAPEPLSQTEALMPEPVTTVATPEPAPEPLRKQEWL
ncbi:MAG TPA: twin-arginine translocase TatA/TatE family subunit [Pyrinomonadaceae bacterium]|nr:twin-arginine translocase TatA/TatE family subunit [Pyrinomonadaceae bacterium]